MQSGHERLSYENKIILAPMVRIGTLPTRLLALQYGADIVYSEEIIDHKLLQCERVQNDALGTVDYVMVDGTVVFRTCAAERGQVVLQMGTSDPNRALKVAKMIEKDVAGIDINMGCPKSFSILGGMGAALLTKPGKVQAILTTLVQNCSIPITCKIRILPELQDTLSLVKLIESTGVAALGIHGRLKEERPRHPNHNDVIRSVVDHVRIPVIANGGSKDMIYEYKDIAAFRESTKASSVMIARAAEWNTSVFRKDGLLPVADVVKDYLKYSIDYDNHAANTKYVLQQLMHNDIETEAGKRLLSSGTMQEMCSIWNMEGYLEKVEHRRSTQEALNEALQDGNDVEDGHVAKRRKLDDGHDVIEMDIRLKKKCFLPHISPKQILYEYTKKHELKPPNYDITLEGKLYRAMVNVNGQNYRSTYWDLSKKFSQQAAAAVCLRSLGLEDGTKEWQQFKASGNQQEILCDKNAVTITGNNLCAGKAECNRTELKGSSEPAAVPKDNGESCASEHQKS